MKLSAWMPLMGRMNRAVIDVPHVGEMVLRATYRALGSAAFRVPLLGSRPSHHIGDVKDQWTRFLALVGLSPTVVQRADGMFEFCLDACPYQYKYPRDQDVCDACLDLVRTYLHLLRGRLEVMERVSHGAEQCRFRVNFP